MVPPLLVVASLMAHYRQYQFYQHLQEVIHPLMHHFNPFDVQHLDELTPCDVSEGEYTIETPTHEFWSQWSLYSEVQIGATRDSWHIEHVPIETNDDGIRGLRFSTASMSLASYLPIGEPGRTYLGMKLQRVFMASSTTPPLSVTSFADDVNYAVIFQAMCHSRYPNVRFLKIEGTDVYLELIEQRLRFIWHDGFGTVPSTAFRFRKQCERSSF